jgi:lysyl-tRNA synthetase class 2
MPDQTNDFGTDAHLQRPEVRENARKRALLNRAIRAFFDARGFLEVETGQLVDEPGQEPHLEPFTVRAAGDGGRFLITSPELRMKRLLAAGFERIYELGHCFRDGLGERSDLHHREFTMLEWYRAGAGADALVADLEGLLPACAAALGGAHVRLDAPFERLSVAEAFARHAGVDLEPFLDGDADAFRAGVRRSGYSGVADGEAAETLFFRVFLDRVEPRLGRERPTVLDGWPAAMAALARLDPADPRRALRFELYVGGVELANAFTELTDAAEQRRRFVRDRAVKRAAGRDPGPLPERFLSALAHMPAAAGIALGVDRLLMLLAGAARIDDVLLFPERPDPPAPAP